MSGLKLDPLKVADELTTFNRRLIDSYITLNKIHEIDTGQTPCVEIYREDKMRLNYYAPIGKPSCNTPLLICYALVNRPYMIDLQPDRSLLLRLLELGIPVYLIDWGYPDPADRYLDLDDYINSYMNECVDQVCQHAGTEQVNLLGICQGGTFSLCYTALHPEKVRNLITVVTPVDFGTDDFTLSNLARHVDADLAVDTYGNIPGELLNDSYNSLMPMRLSMQKNLGMPRQLENRESALNFLRMEKWIYDSPDQAGEAFRQFIKDFFQQNLLIKGEACIGGRSVKLTSITQPLLNIYGSQDHLVPPSSSRALKGLTDSADYQELEVKAGHIGLFVSGSAQKIVPGTLAQWLIERDNTESKKTSRRR